MRFPCVRGDLPEVLLLELLQKVLFYTATFLVRSYRSLMRSDRTVYDQKRQLLK